MLQGKKTVLINACITTLCEELPQAEALCISGGCIEAIGSNKEIMQYVANSLYTIIDCEGNYVYPGFIDTHSHLTTYSRVSDYISCDATCKSISDVFERIQAKTERTKQDSWVLGYQYDPTMLLEQRHLTCHDLDSISTEHPILIYHISGHLAYVNSLAMKYFGITKDSKIEGGEYEKDSDGNLTGLLRGYALFTANKLLPQISIEDMKERIKKSISDYNKCGITTFFDAGMGFGGSCPDCVKPILALDKENALNARAYMQFLPEDMKKLAEFGIHDFGSEYVTFGGLKFFTDGSIQGFSAALQEDYHTKKGFKGKLLFSQENIESLIEEYHSKGIQIGLHTNGDAASEAVICAFEKVLLKYPNKNLRHMIIHAQMVSDEQLIRIKACGLIPSFFSKHIEMWGDRHASIYIGEKRTERLNPAGSASRLGIKFTLHVDTPAMPVTALGSMHVAVNRLSSSGILFGEEQKITPLEALEAYTSSAGILCSDKRNAGTISVGNFADIVILDKSITDNPEIIKTIKVLKTICGGKIVYEAPNESLV